MENREITPPEVGDIFIRFPAFNESDVLQNFPSLYLVFNTQNQISYLNLLLKVQEEEEYSILNLQKIRCLDIFKKHEFPLFYGGDQGRHLMYVYNGSIPLSRRISSKRNLQISKINNNVFFNLIRNNKIKKNEGAIFFGSEKISYEEFEHLSKKKLMHRINDKYPLSELIQPLKSVKGIQDILGAIQANGIDKSLFNLGFAPMKLIKPPTGLQ